VGESPPPPVLERILAISDMREQGTALVLKPSARPCPPVLYPFQLELPFEPGNPSEAALLDQIHESDILKLLKGISDNSVDLAFADPPYNLRKEYADYSDDQAEQKYLAWCHDWLQEYARVLKPGGSLLALNLPKWSITLARTMSQHLHLRNWIVWDSLSEPKGRLMPAHYSLLYFTKGPVPRVFNYDEDQAGPGDVPPPDAPVYCLRIPCRKRRKAAGDDRKAALSDIWTDIHRVRHPRDRDRHPCQLPDALMARIIALTTRPGDVVLDALCGAGTTAIEARKLGRRYIAADIDPRYVEISSRKLAQVGLFGTVKRESTRKGSKPQVTQRALQLELVRLAEQLGRLPTREDAQAHGKYPLELYVSAFPVWSKALGAARARLTGERVKSEK
jgi:site-specific DNA-methyltransferase (adenine-specific)